MSNTVSVVSCPTYDPKTVREALAKVLEPLGGLDWVTPGLKVAIKANLVSMMKPEAAGTTHPALLKTLAAMLIEKGAEVVVGDSPGGLYTPAYVGHVYQVTGLHAVEEAGASLNDNYDVAHADFPDAAIAKTFEYTAWLDRADVIIDFCKLKSHGMMGMSCAAKNMFGCIPGITKPEYHYRFPDSMDFANMLVDLDEYFKPRLSLVDAVVGMEGNGPTAGDPKQIGVLVASDSPHAADLVCADIIGLTVNDVPTLKAAQLRGLIPGSVQELDIRSAVYPFRIQDFKVMTARADISFAAEARSPLGKLTKVVIRKALQNRPQPHNRLCVGCGKCAGLCPAKAIVMDEKKHPVIQRNVCIRCFCCQEFCPVGAMKVHRTWLARLLQKHS